MTGKEFKEIREKMRLSREEMGKMLGKHSLTIYHYERMMKVPTTIEKLIVLLAKERKISLTR